eukprot:6630871-Pyramimonas_sp.AAC.1
MPPAEDPPPGEPAAEADVKRGGDDGLDLSEAQQLWQELQSTSNSSEEAAKLLEFINEQQSAKTSRTQGPRDVPP